MSKRNWRLAPTPQNIRDYYPGLLEWVVIRSDEGKEINPDCTYECAYCGECLGCLKKIFFDDSPVACLAKELGRSDADLEDDFHCQESPDGDHHLIEDSSKN